MHPKLETTVVRPLLPFSGLSVANERTFLSWLRLSIVLAVVSVGMSYYSEQG